MMGFLSLISQSLPAQLTSLKESACKMRRGYEVCRRERIKSNVLRKMDTGERDTKKEAYLDMSFSTASEEQAYEEGRELGKSEPMSLSSFRDPPKPSSSEKAVRVQVITDIDDTVKSSGGVSIAGQYLGGVDTQYRRGEFYPGVFQFALELATNGLPMEVDPLPMAVLTARARELKFALALEEDHPICRKYRYAGMERGYEDWGIGPVLYGSVKEWVFQQKKGVRKFRNFQLLQDYNSRNCGVEGQLCDTKYVYIGDTGELDLHAGKMMLKKYPKEMKAVFLHAVYDKKEFTTCPFYEDTHVKNLPVLFFRTYVGAAKKAVDIGLLDESALRRVAGKALKELLRIEPDHSSSKWIDLMADIKDADLATSPHWLWN